MDEPDWAKVLTALYQGELGLNTKGKEFTLYEVLDYLEDETGLERESIKSSLTFLSDMELIRGFTMSLEEEDEKVMAGLLPKGFEVAHERELDRKRLFTNNALVFFTFALVLVSIVNEFPQAIRHFGWLAIIGGIVLWIYLSRDEG